MVGAVQGCVSDQESYNLREKRAYNAIAGKPENLVSLEKQEQGLLVSLGQKISVSGFNIEGKKGKE